MSRWVTELVSDWVTWFTYTHRDLQRTWSWLRPHYSLSRDPSTSIHTRTWSPPRTTASTERGVPSTGRYYTILHYTTLYYTTLYTILYTILYYIYTLFHSSCMNVWWPHGMSDVCMRVCMYVCVRVCVSLYLENWSYSSYHVTSEGTLLQYWGKLQLM